MTWARLPIFTWRPWIKNHKICIFGSSFAAKHISGHIDIAAGLARQMEARNLQLAHVHEPATIQAVQRQDWEAVLVLADKMAETVTARPLAAIVKARSRARPRCCRP